jgi:hypothetical protein
MGDIFEMVIHLNSKGYEVRFSKAYEYVPSQVLRIELRKDDKHHVQFVDISIKRSECMANKVEYLILRALQKAEWEFEYDFGKE